MPLAKIAIGYKGINTELPPDRPNSGWAADLINWLPHKDWALIQRGAINGLEHGLTGSPVRLSGAWVFGNNVLLGGLTDSGRLIHEQLWAGGTAATAGTTMRHVTSGGTETDVAAAAGTVIGPTYTRANRYVYGGGVSAASTVTRDGVNLPATKLLRWDGSTSVPVAYDHAPQFPLDVIYHYNRLMVIAMRQPDGAGQLEPNTLYFSDEYDGTAALTDSVDSWKDNVTALVNRIYVGDDQDDFLCRAMRVSGALALFKRRSIWMLYGESPLNWTVKPFSMDIGVLSPNAICQYEDGVVFMSSSRGLMYFDGSRLIELSENVRQQMKVFTADHRATVKDIHVSNLGNGYVSVYPDDASHSWAVHVPTRRWTRLNIPGAGAAGNYNWFSHTRQLNDRMVAINPQAITYDGIDDVMKGARDGYDGATDGHNDAIYSYWESFRIRLTADASNAFIRRLLTNDCMTTQTDDGLLDTAPNIVYYEVAPAFATAQTCYQDSDTPTDGDERRDVYDLHVEAPDGTVVVKCLMDYRGTLGGQTVDPTEVYSPTLEFDTTHERRDR